jgi:sulfur carrier protein ThiS
MPRPEGRAQIAPLGLLKRYIEDRKTPILTEEGQTVAEVLEALGIPSGLVSIVLVNGHQELKSYVLQNGDVLELVPLVGGG